MHFLFLRLLFISCHFGLSVCENIVTFVITKRQFISAKTRQMSGQEVREWRVPPRRNLYSDVTKTRRFYLFDTAGMRRTSRHCRVFSWSCERDQARQERHRRDGLISGCLSFGETKQFQFDGGEHKQDRLSNGSNLQGGERHFNKSKLCHPTAPFLHHRKCFSQSTVRILGCLET